MSTTKVMSLDALVPYWRNPRRVTDEAINAVAESIRQFGYQQPIAIDKDRMIVLGHTRYAALRRLGYEKATVKVLDDLSPQQIKQLRVIDNRTSEMSTWDFDSLAAEMGELDEVLMTRFFPEVAAQVYQQVAEDVVEIDASKWVAPPEESGVPEVEFVCPSCFHMWNQRVTRDEVFSGHLNPMMKGETA